MTGSPGPVEHHPGDGCTGQERPLEQAETRLIAKLSVTMVTAALNPGHVEAAAGLGRHIALHYGPYGEFYLAGRLAEDILDKAPRGPRPTGPAPDLRELVRPCDPDALELLTALARKDATPSTQTERCAALDVSTAPLQTFMNHMHARRFPAALAQWHNTFNREEPAPPLVAHGFTAQLIVWAARARTPYTKFAERRAAAPFN